MPTLFSNENIVFPANAGVLVGKEFTHNGVTIPASTNRRTNLPFDIKGNGTDDDTQQIQDLLDTKQFVGGNVICYLPNGTYLVSDTLDFAGYLIINGVDKIDVTVTSGSTTITSSVSGRFTGVNVGDSVRGTGIHPGTTVTAVNSSTNITISQAAWASWNEGNRQKRQTFQGQSVQGTIIKLANAATGFTTSGSPKAVVHTGLIPAQRFSNNVRNLTIDVGTGNPGAIGLRYCAHNQGSARELIIKSSDPGKVGKAGLDLGYSGEPGPCLIKNVEIIGFDTGILNNQPTASVTLENIELEGQLQYGIYQGDNYAQPMFCRKIISKNSVPVYQDTTGNDTNSAITFIDCSFTNNGTPTVATAIVMDRSAIYIKNLTCSDYAKTATNAFDGLDVSGNITEYSPYNGANLGYSSSYKCNHGTVKALDLPIEETPVIPWEQDFSKWAIATNSTTFQTACDTPGITTIYFPNGDHTLSTNVFVRGDVQRIIGCEASLFGSGKIIIEEGSSNTVIIERLKNISGEQIINLSSRTLVISAIITGGTSFSFSNIGADININKIGTGKLFIEDLACDSLTAYGISIWMRQYNPEGNNAPGKLVLYNCKAWILGIKTEKSSAPIVLKENTQAEIFGFFYATSDGTNKIKPKITAEDSEFNATLFTSSFASLPYLVVAREDWNGVLKTLPKNSESITGLSYGIVTANRFKSDRIKTKNIAPALVNVEIENSSFRVGDVNNAWNESLSTVYNTTKQLAIGLHLAEVRDSKIQYNRFNGQVSVWNSKGRSVKIQYNTFDFEKTNSTGICIGLHDSGLTVAYNRFINYSTALRNADNVYPGAHVSISNNSAPLIHNNVFINPVSNAALSFSGQAFTSFAFRFYNNTVITRDSTKAPLSFGSGFANSSAISSATSGTNIYSDFKNNIFYSVAATNTSGIPTSGNTTKTNNSFFNTTAVGSSNQTFSSDLVGIGSLGISLWEYKLTSNSGLRTTGAVISGITPGSNVSIGAFQFGSEWNLDAPGNTGKKVNLLPSSDTVVNASWGTFGGVAV